MPKSINLDMIASQFSGIIANEINRNAVGYQISAEYTKYHLQPFNEMYMDSLSVRDEMNKGDSQFVQIMIVIGFSILLIIWLNYIILNMGVLSKNKSYGAIHNILGGSSVTLLKKYISFALLFSVLVFIIVLFIYPFVYKIIASFSGYHYSLFTENDFPIFGKFLVMLLLFSVLSGTFQYLISKKMVGRNISETQKYMQKRFFNFLIQFQLVTFVVLLTSMFFVNRQIKLIRQSDLGFNTENTFSIYMMSNNDQVLFKQEFAQLSYINAIANGENLFSSGYVQHSVYIEGTDNEIETQIIPGDHNYIEAYDIELLSGKNLDSAKIPTWEEFFNIKRKSSTVVEVLVNEEFVRKAGLKNPIGTILSGEVGNKAQIVGVIENVRNLPFYYNTKPMVVGYDLPFYVMNLVVSVKNGFEPVFLKEVEKFFKERNLASYIDQLVLKYDYETIYSKEESLRKFIQIFSIIILLTMIMGLVGLSLYISESKTKEIGIRKVNGAKISEVIVLLNKDFVKWVAIAFIIATPIAWYALRLWLENFAYKTTLSWWIFALAGLLALGIALLTVSWQSWKAATRNPVESLRYE